MRALAPILVAAFFLAGCFGDGGATGSSSPTPTSGFGLKPKVVYGPKEIEKCTDPAPTPVAANGEFTIDKGYDEIIIAFHASGVGRVPIEVKSKDDQSSVWTNPAPDVNTLPSGTACGTHSHSSSGVTKDIKPGNYSVTMSYSGSIAIHFDITAKSKKSNETDPNHTHPAAP